MKRSIIFWVLSFGITVSAAYYQRVTGPTYPLRGKTVFESSEISYRFERSYGGEGNATIRVAVEDETISGKLKWKRFTSNDTMTYVEMKREAGELAGELPHQPPAGKIEYQVLLTKNAVTKILPEREPVVIRFKGDVPLGVLIPHVIVMFAAMLFSTRTGIECFSPQPDFIRLTLWTVGLMTLGGMILGPIVQKHAFGEYWTGIPFGTDLTDNKTLIAFVAWLAALVALNKSKHPCRWIVTAALITLIIFLIPHSMFGSELNYGKK